MAKLLINPITEKQIQSFMARPTHAVLFIGQEGSGLNGLSENMWHSFTPHAPEAETLIRIEPNEKGTITIESVRELTKKLKIHYSSSDISKVSIISGAESMPAEAQNALLKLLEEPPQGVLFILQASDISKIAPTIRSRCVNIEVLPVSLEQAKEFFQEESTAFVKLYHLSGGQAGLLHELLDKDDHPLVKDIEIAKQLLSAAPYDRIKKIDADFKQRDVALRLVKALLKVCAAGLQTGRASSRWIHNCRLLLGALDQLEANVQPKLVLDRLFLSVH